MKNASPKLIVVPGLKEDVPGLLSQTDGVIAGIESIGLATQPQRRSQPAWRRRRVRSAGGPAGEIFEADAPRGTIRLAVPAALAR